MTYSKQPHRILRPFSEAERKGREGAKISINNCEEKPAAAPSPFHGRAALSALPVHHGHEVGLGQSDDTLSL